MVCKYLILLIFQEIAHQLGGNVAKADHREYGHCDMTLQECQLFKGIETESMIVWMSHGDQIQELSEEFETVAQTATAPFAAIKHKSRPIFGIQFHPEVEHTPNGIVILRNFVFEVCECVSNWSMENFIDCEISRIRQIVGDDKVVGAVSGGVDSTVAAKLMQEAIGNK